MVNSTRLSQRISFYVHNLYLEQYVLGNVPGNPRTIHGPHHLGGSGSESLQRRRTFTRIFNTLTIHEARLLNNAGEELPVRFGGVPRTNGCDDQENFSDYFNVKAIYQELVNQESVDAELLASVTFSGPRPGKMNTNVDRGPQFLRTERLELKQVWEKIRTAITEGATDVWISGTEEGVTVQARIDGRKQKVGDPIRSNQDRAELAECISRAFAVEFEIDSQRLHDSINNGKGHWVVNGERLGLRVNMAPNSVIINGEDRVISTVNIRILRPDKMWDMDSLNFTSHNQQIIEHTLSSCLKQGGGLVLLIGPTGSGKSSTLAGMVNFLIGPEGDSGVGLVTIESSIEYRFPGALQI